MFCGFIDLTLPEYKFGLFEFWVLNEWTAFATFIHIDIEFRKIS